MCMALCRLFQSKIQYRGDNKIKGIDGMEAGINRSRTGHYFSYLYLELVIIGYHANGAKLFYMVGLIFKSINKIMPMITISSNGGK